MKNVKNWLFKQRDIDAQVISLLVAAALSGVIDSMAKGVIDPVVAGVTGASEKKVQKIGPFKFKFQLLLSGAFKAAIILFIVYRFALLTKDL